MTRDPFQDSKVWAWLLATSLLVVALLWLLSCGPNVGRAQQAARTARFVMETLCADTMTVKECGDVMEQNASIVDSALDGGLR